MNKIPNFVIVGAAKSATTTLHAVLSRHPEVTMSSTKETKYFCYDNPPKYKGYGENGDQLMRELDSSLARTFEEYRSYFSDMDQSTKCGETSPAYLYIPGTAEKLYANNPDTKIIIILRNPSERAYSSYMHMRREKAEDLSFEQSLEAELDRISENCGLPWRYMDMGRYVDQVKRYLTVFGTNQVKIILYDDIRENFPKVLGDVKTFLDLKSDFKISDSPKYNESGVYRYPRTLKILKKTGAYLPLNLRNYFKLKVKYLMFHKTPLYEKTKKILNNEFKDEINDLSRLIRRDLSTWH